tara:strand:+ start:350 stop:520 length:171 start_codon:yes stop_codon:yes gene_type:complete
MEPAKEITMSRNHTYWHKDRQNAYRTSDGIFEACYNTLALANCFALFGALTRIGRN